VQRRIGELESGLRGYVLTRDASYLVPFLDGRAAINDALGALDATTDDASVERRLVDLRADLRRWFTHADAVLEAARHGGSRESLIGTGRGKALTDRMHQSLDAVSREQRDFREQHSRLAVRESGWTELLASSVVLVLALGLLFSLMQRRRWKAELHASERRFSMLTGQLTEFAVYLLDAAGKVVSWNAGGTRLLGYEPQEILGQPQESLFPKEAVAAMLPGRGLDEARDHGQFTTEGWLVRKDGSLFWADLVLTALHDELGALTGFATVIRDLTLRKEAEDRLRAAEVRLRTVLESAYDPIVIADGRGFIEFANRRAHAAIQLAPGTLPGRPLPSLAAGEDAQALSSLTRHLAETPGPGGVGVEFELQIQRADGTHFPADMTLTFADDPLGASSRVTAIFRDITEQRLRSMRQRLLAELGHELSKSLDSEEVLHKVVEWVVPALAEWAVVDLRFEDGELSRLAVVHGDPEKQELARRYHEASLRGGGYEPALLQVLDTGEPVLVQEHALARLDPSGMLDAQRLTLLESLGVGSFLIVPLKARGRILGALTFHAARRRYGEDELRFAEEIASHASLVADNARLFQKATWEAQLRQDLMAIVSHDVRNPLHAIRINAQLLGKLAEQPPEPNVLASKLQYLRGTLERAVDQGVRLITDLLDAAKLESGTFSLAPRVVRLDALLDQAFETLEPLAKEKGLTVEREVPPDHVRCDPERMVQVIANLVVNAIKFTPAGGCIRLRVVREGEEVRVGVQDTGPGIAADAVPHLFDRFWQAQSTRTSGAGLGLSIAKGIVEAHGGRIWVESAPNAGSTFWFTLPAESRPASWSSSDESELNLG
jgi:PAS domain S-box-containing protein